MTTNIDHFEVNLLNEIGKGSYGIVYMCKDVRNNQDVAVKKIKYIVKSKEETKLKQSIRTEISIIEKLKNHQNILRYFHHKDDGENFWLFMEFCEHGDLVSYLQNSSNVSLNSKVDIMVQCTGALSYLHSMDPPIVHRDIKPENVLIRCENNQNMAKLCDFGAGRIYDRSMSSLAGTQAFMAPELFVTETDEMKYHPEVDVFSAGLLFKVLFQFEQGSDDQLQFVPVSAASKQFIYYGLEMELAAKENRPFPKLFEENGATTTYETEIQQIIENMTRYKNEDRIKLRDVKSGLLDVHCRIILEKLAGISIENKITGNKGIEDIHKSLIELDMMTNVFESNKKKCEDMQEEFTQSQLSHSKLKKDIESALDNNEILQQKLDREVQEKDQHLQKIEILKQSTGDLESELNELRSLKDNLQAELSHAVICKDKLKLQLTEAQNKNKNFEREIQKLSSLKESLDLELRESVASNEALQNKLTSVLVSREKLQKDMEALISRHSQDAVLKEDLMASTKLEEISQQTMELEQLLPPSREQLHEANVNFWQKFDEVDKFRQTYNQILKSKPRREDERLVSSMNDAHTYNTNNKKSIIATTHKRSKPAFTDEQTSTGYPPVRIQRSQSNIETLLGISSCSSSQGINLSDDSKSMSVPSNPARTTGAFYSSNEPDYTQAQNETVQISDLKVKHTIIDGVNVALCHGKHNCSSAKGIELALKYFIEQEFKHIHVFLQQGLQIKKDYIEYVHYPENYIRSMMELAEKENGIIITNEIHSSKLYPQWKSVIEKQIKGFAFIKDEFIPHITLKTNK